MAAIDRIELRHYRALRHVDIDLADFTVLVGPNGSGKSSVLQAMAGRFEPGDKTAGVDGERSMDVTVVSGGTSRSRKRSASGWPKAAVLQFDLKALRRDNQTAPATKIEASGSNLTNVVASMGRRRQEEFVQAFTHLVPTFSDVNVLPSPRGAGLQELVFTDRWLPGTRYSALAVSDGSMLVLALLALQFQEEPYEVACIEEPERGLHPWLLREVVGLLRKLAEGNLGDRRTQIVIATQSSELLNYVEPEEVRFFSRDPRTGDVTVTSAPTEQQDWQRTLETYEHSMAGLWLSGNLGGVPGE